MNLFKTVLCTFYRIYWVEDIKINFVNPVMVELYCKRLQAHNKTSCLFYEVILFIKWRTNDHLKRE